MKSFLRTRFYIFVITLFLLGLLLTFYRHIVFDVPWMPGEKRQVWSVEAKISFDAIGDPVKASLAIPNTQPGYTLLGEYTASPGYGLSFLDKARGRRAEWSIRSAQGRQSLYYRAEMLVSPGATYPQKISPPEIRLPDHPEPYQTAANEILRAAIERSADAFTLTRELINEFNTQKQSAELLTQVQSRSSWLVDMLMNADVPARVVHTLQLEDGRRRQRLETYLQVFQDSQYQLFNPSDGQQGRREHQLLWEYHASPVLDIEGVEGSTLGFSVIKHEEAVTQVLQDSLNTDRGLLDFSINSLPLGEQTLFKSILLIPVGVLLVVFMRIMVGIRTSGTFMPVLIAIAFIQTSLVTGLIGFLLIVSIGLYIRFYLSHLNLLLVARISTIIITVILIVLLFSVVAFKFGLTEGLKITFFPMVILAWTIERMSILWEEEGSREVLIQGGGSLLVALMAYAAMNNHWVRHLTFNFIGLQLVIMALVMMMGNYTGYRLLEYRRFMPLLRAE